MTIIQNYRLTCTISFTRGACRYSSTSGLNRTFRGNSSIVHFSRFDQSAVCVPVRTFYCTGRWQHVSVFVFDTFLAFDSYQLHFTFISGFICRGSVYLSSSPLCEQKVVELQKMAGKIVQRHLKSSDNFSAFSERGIPLPFFRFFCKAGEIFK